VTHLFAIVLDDKLEAVVPSVHPCASVPKVPLQLRAVFVAGPPVLVQSLLARLVTPEGDNLSQIAAPLIDSLLDLLVGPPPASWGIALDPNGPCSPAAIQERETEPRDTRLQLLELTLQLRVLLFELAEAADIGPIGGADEMGEHMHLAEDAADQGVAGQGVSQQGPIARRYIAALARLESRVAFEAVAERWPRFAVEESGLRRVHMANVAGFSNVPVLAAA